MIDIAYGTKRPAEDSTGGYATKMKRSLTEAYDGVRINLDASHRRQKEIYNKRVHGEPYKAGDLV